MSGRLIAIFLVGIGLVAGAAMYWLQLYAYYEELAPEDVAITVEGPSGVQPVIATNIRAIDSESSPIRFRACFDVETMPEGGAEYPDAVPLTAPGWFDCFDAEAIGEDLAAGRARAVLAQGNVTYGIDRILALYPDGRGYAWHQINDCGEVVFDGDPPPPGCPPVPERPN